MKRKSNRARYWLWTWPEFVVVKYAVIWPALIAAIALAGAGCTDNYYFWGGPPIIDNLIRNGSFERYGLPTLEGWAITGDSAGVGFEKDAPPFGGYYSAALVNQWTFPGAIEYSVEPVPGQNRYTLSVWGKAVRTGGPFAGGQAMLLALRREAIVAQQTLAFSDTLWTMAQASATISSTDADAIIVRLQGSPGQFAMGWILFDRCALEVSRP